MRLDVYVASHLDRTGQSRSWREYTFAPDGRNDDVWYVRVNVTWQPLNTRKLLDLPRGVLSRERFPPLS